MKKLLFSLILFISIAGYSQTTVTLPLGVEYKLSGKSGAFKIVSVNDTVNIKLYKQFYGKFTHFSESRKKDRWGSFYYEDSFSFSIEELNSIINFFKKLNK